MDVTALAVNINNLKLSNDVGISVRREIGRASCRERV